MLKNILSIVVILHGMVHAWYILLLTKAVKYVPEMGWTGESWLIPGLPDNPTLRNVAVLLYSLAGGLFVISGIGLMTNVTWTRSFLVASAILSSILLVIFFDAHWEMFVQKGFVCLIINVVIIIAIILTK